MYVPSSVPSASSANVQSPEIGTRMVRRDEVLAAVFDPLQRAAESPRRERDRELLALREELLPEAAADIVRARRARDATPRP